MKIAYLVNTYPRASHSFIRREIQALERRGLPIHRFAMRSDRAALVDAGDLAEDALTEHLLEAGALRLGLSALGWMAARPAAAWRGLRTALTCGARGAGGRLRHLIYLAEAAHLARRCRALGIGHLHAHFGTNSAIVALLAQHLGGPRYSFTVHGPEEFDAPAALSLRDKIHHAAFTVAISSFGRSQLCRWADPADWPRLQVVHCGVEPGRFAEPAPLPGAGPRLIAIGRLAEQ
ncbi:MAG TPA: glycosyltransferase, partial [Paracoccaceae bacterium]